MGFTFKGLSSDYFQLATRITKMPIIPEKRLTKIPILGRDGEAIFEDAYENVEIHMRCAFMNPDINARRDTAKTIAYWLTALPGSSLVIPNVNFPSTTITYKVVQCVHNINSEFVSALPSEEFDLIFVCHPANTAPQKVESYTLTSGQVRNVELLNDAYYKSTVLVKLEVVFGIASMSVSWSSGAFTVSNMDTGTPVYVDSANMLVYTGTTTKINKIKDFQGSFLTIPDATSRTVTVSSTANSNSTITFTYAKTYL